MIPIEVSQRHWSPDHVTKSPLNKEGWLFFKSGKNAEIYILACFNYFLKWLTSVYDV